MSFVPWNVSETAKKLRSWEAENPGKAAAAGFNPAYGAASGAAAVADPDAAWWEKLLGGAGLVPGGKAMVLLASRLRKHPELLAKAAKFIDPFTGRKMAEIDDSLSSIDKELLDQMSMNNMSTSLEDAYVHPDLFKAEPALSDVLVSKGVSDPKNAGEYWQRTGGGINALPGRVGFKNMPDPSDSWSISRFDNTIRHETQHAVDDAAGILNTDSHPALWDTSKYWTKPSEVRARLAAERWGFSPTGRQKYSFDQHMQDEVRRLYDAFKNNRKMTHATADELESMIRARGIDPEDLIR